MSYVIAVPELMTSAATDLTTIGSALTAAKAAAPTPTTGILVAAEDEVSAAIAAAFHEQFAQALTAGAGSYVGVEAANVSPLQIV
jgi:PE family